MSSKPITLQIRPRGNPITNLPSETTVLPLESCEKLYSIISSGTGYTEHRLRITKGSDGSLLPNSKDVALERTGLKDESWICVKDLGPQISWLTVFIVEYLGPILIHPLFYYGRSYIYPTSSKGEAKFPDLSVVQQLSFALIMIHFIKRELETVFVHRFSLATMPLPNMFRNSAHYWILSGFLIAYTTYSPRAKAAMGVNSLLTYPGLLLFVVGELANLSTHITLRNLRSPKGTERGIPRGLGFDLVTCPNYMFEIISWIGIWMVNRSSSTAVFLAVSGGMMAIWAKQKESKYRKEFGDKYKKKRYSIIPGVF